MKCSYFGHMITVEYSSPIKTSVLGFFNLYFLFEIFEIEFIFNENHSLVFYLFSFTRSEL